MPRPAQFGPRELVFLRMPLPMLDRVEEFSKTLNDIAPQLRTADPAFGASPHSISSALRILVEVGLASVYGDGEYNLHAIRKLKRLTKHLRDLPVDHG